MMKIVAAFIAASLLGCGGIAEGGETVIDLCEMELVLANPGPNHENRCFRAVAGHDSCVRLPGDPECGPFVAVNHRAGYEVWTCATNWGAPTRAECLPEEVELWSEP